MVTGYNTAEVVSCELVVDEVVKDSMYIGDTAVGPLGTLSYTETYNAADTDRWNTQIYSYCNNTFATHLRWNIIVLNIS